jgi:hypothetical protein
MRVVSDDIMATSAILFVDTDGAEQSATRSYSRETKKSPAVGAGLFIFRNGTVLSGPE